MSWPPHRSERETVTNQGSRWEGGEVDKSDEEPQLRRGQKAWKRRRVATMRRMGHPGRNG